MRDIGSARSLLIFYDTWSLNGIRRRRLSISLVTEYRFRRRRQSLMMFYRLPFLILITPSKRIALLSLGESHRGGLLIVSHVERGDHSRLISARELTRTERTAYEEGNF